MPSIQSALIAGLLRLVRRRRRYESPQALHRFIATARLPFQGPPPGRMRRVFALEQRQRSGQAVYTISPRSGAALPHVVYLHGGAYINGMASQHWGFVGRLIDRTPCTVTLPLYGLAPEHTCRQALALLIGLYRELTDAHGAHNIVLMGDSAGGGLALALAQALGTEGLPQPRQIILLSPWLDVTMTHPAIAAMAADDPMLAPAGLREAGRLWAGDLPVTDRRVCPVNGSLTGLAPLTVFMGSRDICAPDARRLRDRAEEQGAPIRYLEYPAMIHAWMVMPMPEAKTALGQIVGLLQEGRTDAQTQ